MPLIPFPDIPKLPGVPQLPRSPSFPPTIRAGLGILTGLIWRGFQTETRWGIFDSTGKALGDPSKFTGLVGSALDAAGLGVTLSTNAVDYSKETRVSDFPIERGSFANYNKVESPAAPVVTFCLGGSENDRRTFLDAIDKATKSTALYSLTTPEVTYVDYAVERYSYGRRSSKGAAMLTVEITLKEIRQVSSQYTQTNKGQVDTPKDAGASPVADSGKVQAKTPDTSTLKAIADKLPALADKAKSLLGGL